MKIQKRNKNIIKKILIMMLAIIPVGIVTTSSKVNAVLDGNGTIGESSIYTVQESLYDRTSFNTQFFRFYDKQGTEKIFFDYLKNGEYLPDEYGNYKSVMFTISLSQRFNIIIRHQDFINTQTGELNDWKLNENINNNGNSYSQASYILVNNYGVNPNSDVLLGFYDYRGIKISEVRLNTPFSKLKGVWLQYEEYDYSDINYQNGLKIGREQGYFQALEELQNLTDQEAYKRGYEDALKTSIGSFDKWIVPAIVVVIILGGIVTVVARKRSDN